MVTTAKAGHSSVRRGVSLPGLGGCYVKLAEPAMPHQPPDELQALPTHNPLQHLLALVAALQINQPNQLDGCEAGTAQARGIGQVDTQDLIHDDLSLGRLG